jgi:DNA-binding transcriptional MerR regulator
VTTYTIGEVAEHSGFTASALRYYEGIGLVVPAGRTGAGYRVYDDGTLARLAFIARAKQLGCTLEEIHDLVGLWDGDRCGPVQRRFHELVTAKMAAAETSIAELAAFRSQLRVAATGLAGEPVDGPCGDGCACVTAPSAAAMPVPAPVPAPVLAAGASIPVACTLEPDERPGRAEAWRTMVARASSRRQLAGGGIRLEFPDPSVVADLAELVAAEQECCAFFCFAITVDARGTGLEVSAPDDATPLVEALLAER